jgi:hypothetical protein
MHENRETSGAPGSNQDRGRSEKAQSRNAGMHASEGSDYAILPMNQPNNEEVTSAEAGEGRAWAKENIVQSNTSPTQSGKRVSQGLSGVRQAAKARKQGTFHRFASPCDSGFASGQLLRFEAESGTRSRRRHVAGV